ncbi:P-loop containing nucleoside triphosphate hydrolase protein [Coprinopsis marcescibilis]|uniref:P-loop containing nucleoside triphosphate hydrolase protein n=1 Tax=Coprinopsis marcescibilis TaxID=230819 RepID=A0A5C3KTU5_COPMA|nr:P-loop containing nucleoside triphosphate hydrolase protein [Coprinopsis marcescibilis]
MPVATQHPVDPLRAYQHGPSFPKATVSHSYDDFDSDFVNIDTPAVGNANPTGKKASGRTAPAPAHTNHTSAPGKRAEEDNEVIIAVMGPTGSGKTTFINTASGSEFRIGRGLKSCTNIVQIATPFMLDGRNVILIDTPGFDDTTKSDTEILRMISAFLATTYEGGKKLAGVIYVHRISDFRMGGIDTRNFKMFRQLCGDTTLKNVVIVTNMWGQVGLDVAEAREKELATEDIFFKPVLDKGGKMMRHDATAESARDILRDIIKNKPLVLQIQREIVDENKDILQTAAGEELNKDLLEQLRKHEEEMAKMEMDMKEAIREKDEETRKEIEQSQRKLQAEMDRVREESEQLSSRFQDEKDRMDEKMNTMREDYRKEQKAAADKYKLQTASLEEKLKGAASKADAETLALKKELQDLRNRPPPSLGFFSMIGRAVDKIFGM